MTVYLPRQGISINDFVSSLTQENILRWRTQFTQRDGTLELPKFKTEYSSSLNTMLQSLGIEKAFDGYRANFNNMIDTNVYISQVKHRTYIDVSERGTEAAAVTFIGMRAGSMLLEDTKKFEMKVDRPFFFTIDDKDKEETLFMGTILNPKE